VVQQYDTVILSDLHLGANNARPDDVLRFLDGIDAHRVIVNGDLFDRPHLGRLGAADLRLLNRLRDLGRTTQVDWLIGNHDPSRAFFKSVLGIDAEDEAFVRAGNRTYLVYHGHGWDEALTWPWWLIAGADGVYRFSQTVDPSHRLARYLKHRCKVFVKAVHNLRDRAIAEARKRGLGGVVLGHSHMSCDTEIDGVHYLNGGCWTEKPASFVGVRDGVVRQEFYEVGDRVTVAVTPPRRRAARQVRVIDSLGLPEVGLPAPLASAERA
jgi:UDP-2,3-diacylglucosamine pyrophosphatase LpxH